MRGSLGGKIRWVSLIRVGGGGGGVAFVDKFSVDSVIVGGFCSLTKGTISAWGGGDTASSSSLIALPKMRSNYSRSPILKELRFTSGDTIDGVMK